jgi:hypothetical protein
MKIKQLSLFVENKLAKLRAPCKALSAAGVNIRTLALADTQQFGILRLLVDDWEKGKAALEDAGCVVRVTEVVAAPVEDRPGGLAELLEVIEKSSLNIEYMYAFTRGQANSAVMIFRFTDPDAAIETLAERGIPMVRNADL